MSTYQYPAPPAAAQTAVPVADPTAVMGRRVVAFLVDSAIVVGPAWALTVSEFEYFPEDRLGGLSASDYCDIESDAGHLCVSLLDRAYVAEDAPVLGWAVGLGLTLLVFVVLQGLTGATPGKALLGIRTVREDGSRPGIGKALVRWLLMVVDGLCAGIVGFVVALTSAGHRRVGDMAAKTFVVRKDAAGRPIVAPSYPPPAMAGYPGAPTVGGPGWGAPPTAPPAGPPTGPPSGEAWVAPGAQPGTDPAAPAAAGPGGWPQTTGEAPAVTQPSPNAAGSGQPPPPAERAANQQGGQPTGRQAAVDPTDRFAANFVDDEPAAPGSATAAPGAAGPGAATHTTTPAAGAPGASDEDAPPGARGEDTTPGTRPAGDPTDRIAANFVDERPAPPGEPEGAAAGQQGPPHGAPAATGPAQGDAGDAAAGPGYGGDHRPGAERDTAGADHAAGETAGRPDDESAFGQGSLDHSPGPGASPQAAPGSTGESAGAGADTSGTPGTPEGASTSDATSGDAAATGAAGTGQGTYNPQWDAARGTYIVWEPGRGKWLAWDDAAKEWKTI